MKTGMQKMHNSLELIETKVEAKKRQISRGIDIALAWQANKVQPFFFFRPFWMAVFLLSYVPYSFGAVFCFFCVQHWVRNPRLRFVGGKISRMLHGSSGGVWGGVTSRCVSTSFRCKLRYTKGVQGGSRMCCENVLKISSQKLLQLNWKQHLRPEAFFHGPSKPGREKMRKNGGFAGWNCDGQKDNDLFWLKSMKKGTKHELFSWKTGALAESRNPSICPNTWVWHRYVGALGCQPIMTGGYDSFSNMAFLGAMFPLFRIWLDQSYWGPTKQGPPLMPHTKPENAYGRQWHKGTKVLRHSCLANNLAHHVFPGSQRPLKE